ncbi:tetratricopeptide (TPR) repeat protein [Croceifilum oryzae]|uniref:Tetratricopeptide (TPR) repeat protein n=1 Tax=Croceifilum oryzae TaxID=1553429 RepID=A0AAJ1WP19_9BACL|nr:helix-turn-helix domain-containing protein [Croceifilum oryzae]MDQ0416097.1 tetratricopeptide (TPR) repeat protein [Croceifilum oryzae]
MKTIDRFFIPSELGEVFRKAREQKKVTQLDLALETNLHQSFISKVERGAYQANRDRLQVLCESLNLNWDQLDQYVKQAPDDELDIQLLLMEIRHSISFGDLDEGLENLRRLEETRRVNIESNKDVLTPTFNYLRGRCAEKKQKWHDALEYYALAERTSSQFPELESSNLLASSCNALGRIYNRVNDLHQALSYLDRGIEVYVANGQRQYIIYHLKITKAIVLEKLNRDMEALYLIEELWTERHLVTSSDARLSITQVRIELFIKLGRIDEAIQLALEDLDDARINSLFNRCFELWSSLGDCYTKKKLFTNAQLCYQSALKLERNMIRGQHLTITTYTQLGILNLIQNAYQSAQSNLEEAVKRGELYRDNYRLVKALSALGSCFIKQSEETKALQFLNQALELASKHSFDLLKFDILLDLTDIYKRSNPTMYQNYLDQLQDVAIQLRREVGLK